MTTKALCLLFGHKDRKFLVDGDGVHLKQCCIIRVRICNRCDRMKLTNES